jgi:hypothetical protein
MSWQLLRIEANGTDENDMQAPLRLITSDGKCRLAVKKCGSGVFSMTEIHGFSEYV